VVIEGLGVVIEYVEVIIEWLPIDCSCFNCNSASMSL